MKSSHEATQEAAGEKMVRVNKRVKYLEKKKRERERERKTETIMMPVDVPLLRKHFCCC